MLYKECRFDNQFVEPAFFVLEFNALDFPTGHGGEFPREGRTAQRFRDDPCKSAFSDKSAFYREWVTLHLKIGS